MKSKDHLTDIYRWLYRTSNQNARNSRIRLLLEYEAFEKIHQSWQKLGFPFNELIPSYATALGASADRPDALAQLMGIIQNGGFRLPTVRVTDFHFAKDTPYETALSRTSTEAPQQVLSESVSKITQKCLIDIVEQGTAVRARNAFKFDSLTLVLGGKTGTGDHRHRRFNKAGGKVEEKVMNRTATFAFFLENNFFGTIVAMVPGEDAKNYSFTSSYPVQLLKTLAPVLEPMLKHDPQIKIKAPQKEIGSPVEKHEEGIYEMQNDGQSESNNMSITNKSDTNSMEKYIHEIEELLLNGQNSVPQ